jgi:hypothetical protein
MAFTRFHDDSERIKKRLLESDYPGRYQLNCPGPGLNLPLFEDPNIRLQGWGANLNSNTIELENELRGYSRPYHKDLVEMKPTFTPNTPLASFPSLQPFVEESRATHPAWMYKELEQSKWEHPYLDPQAYLEKPFLENIQTRILEKDTFPRK